MKKFAARLLVITMCISILPGCNSSAKKEAEPDNKVISENKSGASTQGERKDSKLFDKPVTLKMMIASFASWPYQDDWYITKAIKERTGVDLEVIPVAEAGWNEKLNLTMASGELPDLLFGDRGIAHKYGDQGAFADVLKDIKKLPNFSKWYEKNKEYASDYMSADGKLYVFPEQGIAETNRRGFLYREDIFKKHNLQVPKDEKEFYEVLKKLKELYPDSYPFAFRINLGQFIMLAPSWGAYHEMYYDRDVNQWKYGPIENNYKEMIAFYHKLYQEKLIPTDFLSIDTKGWQDLMSTSSSFITIDYLGRIDFFNIPLRKENPEFSLAYMPPFKGGTNGVNKLAYSAGNTTGMHVAASSKKLEDALRYVDWFYTDEAKELVSWGEEGKTYQTADGQRKFIDAADLATVRKKYGLSTNGFYILLNYDAHISTFSKELSQAVLESRKYDLLPIPSVVFNEKEKEINQTIGTSIDKHMQEQISKFLLGTKPLTEWDKYVKEIKDMNVEKLIDIYKNAYDRQTGK